MKESPLSILKALASSSRESSELDDEHDEEDDEELFLFWECFFNFLF